MSKITEFEECNELFGHAKDRYKKDLERIFPEGSLWFCWHGSKYGYTVKVIGTMLCDLHGSVRVENTETKKKKWVVPSSLRVILD